MITPNYGPIIGLGHWIILIGLSWHGMLALIRVQNGEAPGIRDALFPARGVA